MLKGFNFNVRSMLNAILYRPYTLDTSSGEIEIVDLVPINHIAAPPNSTHVSFTAAWGKVNFADGVSDLSISPAVNLPIDSTQTTVTATPPTAPGGTGTDVFILLEIGRASCRERV